MEQEGVMLDEDFCTYKYVKANKNRARVEILSFKVRVTGSSQPLGLKHVKKPDVNILESVEK